MTSLVPIVLVGWLIASVLLFATLRGRRAVVACAVGGTLFLPVGGIVIPVLPDYTKSTAVSLGLVLGIVLLEASRLTAIRLRWFDIPALAIAVLPFATSLSNGLGPIDGLSSAFGAAFTWTVPYLVGRLYFTRLEDMHDLAFGFVVGALVYVPLCLLEVRLSPQLHTWVYGYYPSHFQQSRRYGGFRPTVFMNHGLAVAEWMAFSTLSACWLRASGFLKRIWGVSANVAIAALVVTTVLCKSGGPLLLLTAGLIVLVVTRVRPARWALLAILAFPVAYVVMRLTGVWSVSDVVDPSASIADDERVGSLRVRVESEEVLIQRALAQPVLGWGGWGRNRPEGQKDLVTDGLWVILFSQGGFLRLFAYFGMMLLPAWHFACRLPARTWLRPSAAPAVALALLSGLMTIDCLFNAGVNPFFMVMVGAVSGAAAALPPRGTGIAESGTRSGTLELRAATRGRPAPRQGGASRTG